MNRRAALPLATPGLGCAVMALVLLGCGDRPLESSEPPSSLAAGFVKTRVAGGLGNPVAMAFAPDGRIFVASRGTDNGGGTATGHVRIVKNGALLATPFASVTVDNTSFPCCNERGLVGIALDPAFAQNGFVYVDYTVPGSPAHDRVSRFTAAGDVAQGGETILLELDGLSAPNHNGGAMHFGSDGKLYIAVGNNVVNANSQSVTNRLGKLLRVNPDGSIPGDNPTTFPGVAGSPSGANRAIWALGFRNPFTFAVNPATGQIFVNDVGENSREEIDQLGRGNNYGWPGQEGTSGADNPSFTRPVFDYGHGDQGACAITGGTFYHPGVNTFGTSFLDKYFFADYCGGWIRVLDPTTRTASGFDAGLSQPVDLAVGGDGALYVLTAGSGEIWRIQAAHGAQDLQVSTGSLTVDAGTTGAFTVQLAAPPPGNVTVEVAVREGDPSITVSPATLTFAPATWNVPQTVTVAAGVNAARGVSVGAAISCLSPGLPPHEVVVLARDALPSGPSAEISLPHAGDTIRGTTVDFFGQNTGPATTIKAEFYIDGALAYTDVVTAPPGHYHYLGSHQSLNSTLLTWGRHALAMKVVTADGHASTHQVTVDVKNGTLINFQPASAPTPDGYLVDSGQTYGARNGLTYGWSFDHTDVVRDRDLEGDQRLDTLCHFHHGGVWEIAVPNGTYSVTVGIGDAQNSSTYTLRVEGTPFWTARPLAAGEFVNATRTVQVTDGKLTVDQGTAIEKATRIDYIEISGAATPAPGVAIVNANSTKCLDVAGGGTADGTNIQQWTCTGGDAQRFELVPDGTSIRIRNVGSEKCVDIAGGATADGTNIQLWSCNGTAAQLFERTAATGRTALRNPQSGKCIDVDNAGTADGTNIKLWPCNGTLAQAFDVR